MYRCISFLLIIRSKIIVPLQLVNVVREIENVGKYNLFACVIFDYNIHVYVVIK